jgi:hypothetical protein
MLSSDFAANSEFFRSLFSRAAESHQENVRPCGMELSAQKHPSAAKVAAVLPHPPARLKPCPFKAAIQNPNAFVLDE